VTAHVSLSLAIEPIERVDADVAFVTIFRDERPLRGSAGRVDWRLCGRLSRLLREERWVGEVGEAALIPTQGGLRAPLLIAAGLGARATFDASRCRAAARDAVERARRLRASTLALVLLEAGAGAIALEARLEALLRGVLGAPSMGPKGSADSLGLRLVVAPAERPAALEWLRAVRGRGLPSGVEVLVPDVGDARRVVAPRGAKSARPPDVARPLVK